MKAVLNISRAKIENGIGISPIKIVANRENCRDSLSLLSLLKMGLPTKLLKLQLSQIQQRFFC